MPVPKKAQNEQSVRYEAGGCAVSEVQGDAPKAEIVQNHYDLSINRYKQVVYQEQHYDPPEVILQRIKELQKAMNEGVKALEKML